MVSAARSHMLSSIRSSGRRITRFTVLILAILSLTAGHALPAQSLRKRLDRVLDTRPLNRHLWGVAVADSSGRLLYSRNADRLFIPASNTKLVVTAVAASRLPADFTVRTSVYATGPVTDGVVMGHLVLYGRGDPSMDARCFAVDTTLAGACARDAMAPLRQLARSLWANGVRTVTGGLIGDGSYFDSELRHPTWEHADLTWWYAAPVSGLGFTGSSVELNAVAAGLGGPAAVTVTPWLGELSVDNRTRTVPEGMARTLDVVRAPGTDQLTVLGDVPVAERPATESVAVTDPNRYTALVFRQALAEEGIAVLGGTAGTTDSLLYQQARRGPAMAEVESRPLRDWLFPILNTSQNWYAEMLLKQLGRQFGQAGSWHEGLEVERRFLIDSVGIDSTQFSLSDGSGLSRINLVTPAAFVRLLAFMRRQPSYPAWSAGLPVSGAPGSLRARFVGGDLEGRVMAKTGSISTVNTLSGYLTRPDGRVLIFSIQANHHTLDSRSMIAAIDSIVGELAR
jgi:D-alanyl-D-alanine carboxypeptidase/D-alanyl-D-alanine-endopeptidase (penicillin-binding protein 4)